MVDAVDGEQIERKRCRVFLCHNSLDKASVKQVADALELEFGIPHFLDEYAIPTGEAFIPWIEEALERSSGCAVFLGGNGWGPSHRWEAELALLRYKQDPHFKIIPIVLPGVREEDMNALGDGSVFKDINWADLRESLQDPVQLEKLRRALIGDTTENQFGPDRLTPFLVRRAARRWAKTGENSLLYRGAELEAARKIVRDHPDLVVLGETQPFIDASALGQRRFWQRLTATLTIAVVLIAALAVLLRRQRDVARDRLAESQSRQLALAAPAALGPDRVLLLSVEAVHRASTAESRENLLRQLDTWRELRWVRRIDADLAYSLAYEASAERVVVGDWLGHLSGLAVSNGGVGRVGSFEDHGALTSLASSADGRELWMGFEDGSLRVLEPGSESSSTLVYGGAETLFREGRRLDTRGLALAISGTRVAFGDGAGQLRIFDRARRSLVATVDTGSFRVADMAFDASGRRLAVGTDTSFSVLDADSLEILDQLPERSGGVITLRFLEPEDSGRILLAVLSGYGRFSRYELVNSQLLSEDHQQLVPPTCGAIDSRTGAVAVGDGEGMVAIYESYSSDPSARRQAHPNGVAGVAFGATPNDLFSVGSGGSVAAWRLDTEAPIARVIGAGRLAPTTLRPLGEDQVLVAETNLGEAGIWRSHPPGDQLLVDLIEVSRSLAGDEILASGGTGDDGFENIESEVVAIALDLDGEHAAWSTLGRGLFVASLADPLSSARLLLRTREIVQELRLADDGTFAFREGEDRIGWLDRRIGHEAEDQQVRFVELPSASRTLALHGPRRLLAVSLEDNSIGLWSLEDGGQRTEPRPGHRSPAAHLLFTPDGSRLVSAAAGGGIDRSVAVWRIPDLSLDRRFQMRQAGGSATGLAVSPDGRLLAVPDHNGQILLWDLASSSALGELSASGSWVSAVAFDGPGTILTASGSKILAWNLDLDHWVRLACVKAGRSFTRDEWREILPGERWRETCQERAG